MTAKTAPVAVVTGGTSGIGRAAAAALGAEGFAVAVLGRRIRDLAAEQCEPVRPRFYVCDVTQLAAARETVEAIRGEMGRIDVLVNAAGGVAAIEPADQLTPDSVRRTVEVCLFGTINMTMACIPALKETRGAIINVSSAISERPTAGFSGYAAAKGGVEAFSRAVALELGRHGVRVNVVSPSMVRTDFFATAGMEQEDYEALLYERGKTYPLGRVGEPEDVANMIAYLASSRASWITGAIIPVDGGRRIT